MTAFRFFAHCSLLVACGSVGASSSDAGPQATTAPDGNGVCCPMTVTTTTCNPSNLYFGGWAAQASQCRGPESQFDGYPVWPSKDAHGCAVAVPRTDVAMCGAPPPSAGRDASPDSATSDGGSDADAADGE